MAHARLFEAAEVDISPLRGRTVAVIGYGSQGHAHALNLRDAGVRVLIGARDPDSSPARLAGFEVLPVADAARAAEIVALLIPDTAQPAVYTTDIAPNLKPGSALLFAHGFNIHFGQIQPAPDVDVILVAPKGPGAMVRREFVAGRGVPSLVAVHQDATGRALQRALAWAGALGSHRAGLIQTTFGEETETDLFGEQAVLCGGVSALIKAGFETLVEHGYSPELAYFECLHEMKLIVDLIHAGGLNGMRAGVSDTAEYGDYVSGPRIVDERTREAMRAVLADIRSGEFAKRWTCEAQRGGSEFQRMRAAERHHPIERVGLALRARMAWLQESA